MTIKTAGQKMYENHASRAMSSGSADWLYWGEVSVNIRELWECTAKTTYEDDVEPKTAVEKFTQWWWRYAASQGGGDMTESQVQESIEELELHDDLPDGELLPCPVCGAVMVVTCCEPLILSRIACSKNRDHMIDLTRQEVMDCMNATIRILTDARGAGG